MFTVYIINSLSRVTRKFLVAANNEHEAAVKFLALAEREEQAGEPIMRPFETANFAPLEMENGVVEL